MSYGGFQFLLLHEFKSIVPHFEQKLQMIIHTEIIAIIITHIHMLLLHRLFASIPTCASYNCMLYQQDIF